MNLPTRLSYNCFLPSHRTSGGNFTIFGRHLVSGSWQQSLRLSSLVNRGFQFMPFSSLVSTRFFRIRESYGFLFFLGAISSQKGHLRSAKQPHFECSKFFRDCIDRAEKLVTQSSPLSCAWEHLSLALPFLSLLDYDNKFE